MKELTEYGNNAGLGMWICIFILFGWYQIDAFFERRKNKDQHDD